jgi:hypothetical protein
MAPGLRIQWTGAVIEKLAVPPPGAIAAAVDRFMTPPVPTGPAPVKPSTRRPTRKLYPVRVAASSVAERAAPRSDVAGAGQPAERTASSMPSVPNEDGAAKAPAARPTTWARVPKPAIWFALFLAVVAGAIWLRSGHPAAQPATGGIGVPSVAQTEAPAAGVAPDSVVAQYYELVMARNFDQAVALWDGDLRASLPPAQYPQQRFADTTQLVVNSAQIVSQDSSTATVAVDLTEVTGGVQHHWVGTWRVVKTGGAWLLDTPDFRAA